MIKIKNSIRSTLKCCKVNLIILMVILGVQVRAGKDPIKLTQSYVYWYAEEAVEQMIKFRIPASVTLAQAIFESNCGNSTLAKKSNNHFGIKCHTTWGGDTVVKTDDTLNECFRKYSSVEDSYTDHSLFLQSRSRYQHLFKLSVTDYKGWCRGLKAAGYATFSGYAEELIKIIEENKLYVYDASERIEPVIIFCSNENLVPSKYQASLFSLKELAKNDVLFINERDLLIQSLELVTEPFSDINEDIAEK